jgi:DNA-binding IclR family transcriptional regulator
MTNQVQTSVERALAILDSFRMGDQALSLAVLAQRTGLYKSTILRLCESLQRQNYLERLDGGGYRLGAAAVRLGEICKRSNRIDAIVPPVLQELVAITGESAALLMRRGDTMVCLRRVDSPRMVREYILQGDVLPLVGAPGRIFRHFERLGDPSYRGHELAASQRTNPPRPLPIVTRGEYDPELATVACGVFGPDDELLGVMALTGPRTRFRPRAARTMGAALWKACETLTTRTGGNAARLAVAVSLRRGKTISHEARHSSIVSD